MIRGRTRVLNTTEELVYQNWEQKENKGFDVIKKERTEKQHVLKGKENSPNNWGSGGKHRFG